MRGWRNCSCRRASPSPPSTTSRSWSPAPPHAVRDAILLGALLAGPGAVPVPALVPADGDHRPDAAGRARRDLPVPARARHELQHDDPGRHGRGGRPGRRRCGGDARAYDAADAGGRAEARDEPCSPPRPKWRSRSTARRLATIDHLPAARLHQRRHRRLLQGAGADHDDRARPVAALCPLRHPAARGPLAALQGRRGGRRGERADRRGSSAATSAPRRAPSPARSCSLAIVGLGWPARRVWPGCGSPSGFMPQMDEGGFILDYRAAARRRAHRYRPAAAPGRADHRRDTRGRELFAAHRRSARRRPHRGRRGRLFHPPQGRHRAGRSRR